MFSFFILDIKLNSLLNFIEILITFNSLSDIAIYPKNVYGIKLLANIFSPKNKYLNSKIVIIYAYKHI